MHYHGKKRIVVHFPNNEVRILVVTEIKIEDGVVRFGRNDGSGWYELLAAPLTSILYWD